jgi:hypothetical protein
MNKENSIKSSKEIGEELKKTHFIFGNDSKE